jgi:DNA-directed RNA polymerase III subunit RPC3
MASFPRYVCRQRSCKFVLLTKHQRIFATLLSRGRLTLRQLAQETTLNSRHLQLGLVVLIQHNLLYHYVDPATKVAAYEANATTAYSLLRVGKILDVVEQSLGKSGTEAREVMEAVFSLGQARLTDLHELFRSNPRSRQAAGGGSVRPSDLAVGTAPEERSKKTTSLESWDYLTSIVAALAEVDLVDVVTAHSFQSPRDIYRDIEKKVIASTFPGGASGSKQRAELGEIMRARLEEMHISSQGLKRDLINAAGRANKKRKVHVNGDVSNGIDHGAYSSVSDVSTAAYHLVMLRD